MPPIRRVLVLAVDGVQSLDVMGPIETFCDANDQVPGTYRIDVVGPALDGQITMSNGLKLGVDPLPEPPPRIDTLVVAGGEGARRASDDPAIVDWVARASRRARRTTSICTGSYLLAAAGLLDGRRATTHWNYCAVLAQRYPEVELDPDPVFVRDGNVWTSAGVTAGIDLALALVEEDLGAEVALAVARLLVVFFKRPGGQSQFSGALSVQQASRPALRELQAWIAGASGRGPLGRRAGRPRGPQRALVRARLPGRGRPDPGGLRRGLRVERARALLEDGAQSLEAVARAAGFSSPEVLRRAFHRRLGVSPAAYRERFRLAA